MGLKLILAIALCLPGIALGQHRDILRAIQLPKGFSISVFAEVPQARHMARTPDGSIYVTSKNNQLYRLIDRDGDGRADRRETVLKSLSHPGGVAYHKGEIYLGLLSKVVAFDPKTPSKQRVVAKGFKADKHHGRRILSIGPDNRLYVTLGAPCNICKLGTMTGKIISYELDGSNPRLVADGVRNSVGLDWHPVTQQLWFTDNGADRMGDELPADELNVVTQEGAHFGFPWRGGKNTPLTGYKNRTPPVKLTGAALEMQAHSANLGMDFYSGKMFPRAYQGDAFIAQHGSWNRSTPIGYRVMRVQYNAQGKITGKTVFADGWLQGNRKLGRPVDIEELADGSLLVSDDRAGLIYRIAYDG